MICPKCGKTMKGFACAECGLNFKMTVYSICANFLIAIVLGIILIVRKEQFYFDLINYFIFGIAIIAPFLIYSFYDDRVFAVEKSDAEVESVSELVVGPAALGSVMFMLVGLYFGKTICQNASIVARAAGTLLVLVVSTIRYLSVLKSRKLEKSYKIAGICSIIIYGILAVLLLVGAKNALL